MGRWDTPSHQPITPGRVPQGYLVTDEEKNKWNGKQDALQYDRVPTLNSSNMLKSTDIYAALENIKNNLTSAYKEFFNASKDGLRDTSLLLQQTQTGIEAAIIELEEVRHAVENMHAEVETRTNAAFSYRNGAADSAAASKMYAEQAFNTANRIQASIDDAVQATSKAAEAADKQWLRLKLLRLMLIELKLHRKLQKLHR